MGAAMAIAHSRAGLRTAVLGTRYDDASIDAIRTGRPHPALGIVLDPAIEAHPSDGWSGVLQSIERIVIAVSSDGLADMVGEVASAVPSSALWVIATKGWDGQTLRTPSEVVASAVGSRDRLVILAGPALAPELVAGAPTAMVCASSNVAAAEEVARSLARAGISATVTDDVAGAEIAAAYKNVTAIAVGMCEGLGERLPERVFVHSFANARAALFALGLSDMARLAAPIGGRMETILGPAGAGDLFVTCLGGRNGKFGRLLGSGQGPEQARATIGSTVEGVPNTHAALKLAERTGVDVVVARTVASVLDGSSTPEESITAALAADVGT
jgi:glycerol-3-phosphate dehydrogenase (NAD(P)+)